MSNASPPPIKKSTRFFSDKDCVLKQTDRGPGRITDRLIARCYVDDTGRAQAYKHARLFAESERMLAAIRYALLNDSGLSDVSCDAMRAIVDKVDGASK